MDAKNQFVSFLTSQGVKKVNTNGNIEECINHNFAQMNESMLKQIVTLSLKHRDDNLAKGIKDSELLGIWGEIIDAVKAVMMQRRELAATNFQRMIRIGQTGDKSKVDAYLSELHASGSLDHLFVGILVETKNSCKAHGQEDNFYMLQYFEGAVETLREHDTDVASVTEAVARSTISTKVEDSFLSASNQSSSEDLTTQQALIAASDYINNLIRLCAGDVSQLRQALLQEMRKEAPSRSIVDSHFHKALADNIEACENASYVNKVKILKFMQSTIVEEQQRQSDAESNDAVSGLGYHHAPQFINDASASTSTLLNVKVKCPEVFIDATFTPIAPKIKNNKKKSEKREAQQKVDKLSHLMAQQLATQGYTVVDNFIPLDVVRRLRIEAGLFKEKYELSEIWVGKEAEIGAHLSVPSVRGDKVLWMCGGHTQQHGTSAATEGVSRSVKTIGEIEPCKLDVKASAPIRRFNALKEVISSCDKIVDELKPQVDKVKNVYERSDVMLSIYPGEGARFARHIDNTTLDGRRLTAIIYLNPGWANEQGGALRITPLVINESGASIPSAEMLDIYPIAGRLVIFYSSEIAHEVLPTFGDRHALTIWYYDTQERTAAVEKALHSGKGSVAGKASIESQQAAKEFIAQLMGGDEVGADGGEPTIQELSVLSERVKHLSNDVISIVANITGAPSVESFRNGFELLVPADLKAMRKLFRNMGMK